MSTVKLLLLVPVDQVYQIFRLLHDKNFVWHSLSFLMYGIAFSIFLVLIF